MCVCVYVCVYVCVCAWRLEELMDLDLELQVLSLPEESAGIELRYNGRVASALF